MFSHLDDAFRSFDTDGGALLRMLTPEGAGLSLLGEIPEEQGGNAGCLTSLHIKQRGAENGQHLLLLRQNLSLGVLTLCLLSPPIVVRVTLGRSILEAPMLAQSSLPSLGTERTKVWDVRALQSLGMRNDRAL